MSAVPSTLLPTLLHRTRTVVLDLLFMRKHALTQTQMQVMYYLIMLKTWVTFKEDEFYVILSSKIERDLNLSPKTVEASITKLKQKNLISTKRLKVEIWNPNRTYRAIKIATLGREYNLSHYKESDYQRALELERENEAFRVQNDQIQVLNTQLERENEELKIQNQSLTLQQASDEKIAQEAIKSLEEKRKLKEELVKKEVEIKQLKKELEMKKEEKPTPQKKVEKERILEDFRKKVTKEYAQSGKSICNGVKNADGWAVDTQFYINSYNRLSIYLPNGELTQIKEPKKISNFWDWLFSHQHRVGKSLNNKKIADISTLKPFLEWCFSFNNHLYKIHTLTPVVGGIKMVMIDENDELITISNGFGSEVLDVKNCREWFENYGAKVT